MSSTSARPFSWAEWSALDGVEIAGHIRQGSVTVSEVALQAAEALHWVDERLAALVEVFPSPVFDAAASGGCLSGVPIVLKDLGSSLAGVRQEQGSALFRGHRATETDPLVANLLDGGLSIVGRSACAELGMSYDTTSDYRGLRVTRNPWHSDFSPGGSSGGSAALVAAGALPIAHGSDGAGSIRIPAALCGLIGLKVTRGRLPMPWRMNEYGNPGMVEGFLTRSVRDTAAAIDAASSRLPPGSSFVVQHCPWPSLRDALAQQLPRLRIGIGTGRWGRADSVPRDAIDSVSAIAAKLSTEGHSVEIVDDRVIADWDAFWGGFQSFWVGVRPTWWPADTEDAVATPILQHYRKAAASHDKMSILRHAAHVKRSSLAFGGLFERLDLLLTPTLGSAAPIAHGALSTCRDRAFEDFIGDLMDSGRYTIPANETGLPAITIPIGIGIDSVPLGLQAIAPWHREDRLLQLALALLRDPGRPTSAPAVHIARA